MNRGRVIHFVSPVIFMIVGFTAIRHLHATIPFRDPFLFHICKCLYVFTITLFCEPVINLPTQRLNKLDKQSSNITS